MIYEFWSFRLYLCSVSGIAHVVNSLRYPHVVVDVRDAAIRQCGSSLQSGKQTRAAESVEEAGHLGHADIDAVHLLLGLLNEIDSLAASVLHQNGMRLDGVRHDVVEILNRAWK
jgi:hypothetical protein